MPTMLDRPRTTASFPSIWTPDRSSNSIHPYTYIQKKKIKLSIWYLF
jgi:hypothetical protein